MEKLGTLGARKHTKGQLINADHPSTLSAVILKSQEWSTRGELPRSASKCGHHCVGNDPLDLQSGGAPCRGRVAVWV